MSGKLGSHNLGVHGTSFCGFSIVHELLYAYGWAKGRTIAIGTPHGCQSAPEALRFVHRVYQIMSKKQYTRYRACVLLGEMVHTKLCS
jgi:hypothetical protein